MTDQHHDPEDLRRVSRRYREMGAEEPPRTLDDAILAAAKRSARPWTQRWAVPLSLAAVVVLSVMVTLRIQHEQPGIESPVPQAVPPLAAVKEAAKEISNEVVKPVAPEEMKIPRRKSAEQPAPPAAAAPAAASAPEPKPFVADQPVASARSDDSRGAAAGATGSLLRQTEERTSRDAEAAARAPQPASIQALAKRAERAEAQAAPQAQKPADTPERELERIAELRRQGRHEEADRAFAEFRKRYPEFSISDEMRARVERR